MKLEQKIFIQSFALMILALYIIGHLLIYNNHTNNMESKIDTSISEHNRLLASIHHNYTELENDKNAAIDFNYTYVDKSALLELQDIVKVVNDTIKSNQENSIATKIYLYSSGNLLCRNDILLEETTLNTVYPRGDHVYSCILEQSTGKELFISSSFTVNKIEYILITKQNIDDIYEIKNRNIHFFIRIALCSSVFGAIALRFSIRSIVKKLSKLQEDIKEIEMGKDTNITIFEGYDEISALSKSFGNMTNQLKEDIKKMENKANSNEFFIHTLAHEMRSLTAILSSSTEILLTDSSLTEQQKTECITRIHKSANSIDKIKESLMELLSINSKSIQKKYINISNIILTVCNLLKQDEKYKKIDLFTNIQKDILLFANEDLMKILLKNFLLNSVEASNFQGRIEVYVSKTYFKIVDFGSGIPEDKQKLILQPFVTIGKKNGLGLGLTLCEKIATIHNTYFTIHNNAKKNGTTVIYYF
ncbi:MAG: HAMP domain-containing histidine kinase [Clostridia bacterium]|nr:HAMP domain-containing histidine kinase [Clostridia bacterium]